MQALTTCCAVFLSCVGSQGASEDPPSRPEISEIGLIVFASWRYIPVEVCVLEKQGEDIVRGFGPRFCSSDRFRFFRARFDFSYLDGSRAGHLFT